MIARLLQKFTDWALAKNASGGYAGEDDKRWAYTIGIDGDAYLTRVLFPRLFGVRVFLHHFHRPDAEQDLHSHPWTWTRSLVLSGAYDEERLEDIMPAGDLLVAITDKRTVRWFNKITDADYHRVTKLHGDVWTLFITGPRTQDWGFLVDGKHVPWKTYLGKDKAHGQ